MHLRVIQIAGGFYHTVVLLRQRNNEVNSAFNSQLGILNPQDFKAYNNQYNMMQYTNNYSLNYGNQMDPFEVVQ